MEYEELRRRLVESPDFANNALFPYQAALESMDDRSFQLPRYDCGQTQRELDGSGIVCPPVDAQLLGTYLRYLRRVGFIPSPEELSARPERSQVPAHAMARGAPLTQHATA
jgi:hypothetical protein